MKLNRRSFLQTLGFTSIGLVGFQGLQAAPKVEKKIRPNTPVKLSGTVRADGKGVAGVSVTDGLNITQTDSKGNYNLQSINAAEFVYI